MKVFDGVGQGLLGLKRYYIVDSDIERLPVFVLRFLLMIPQSVTVLWI